MNDIPLIQKADINSINTSIIAIKKQLKQLNEALGLVDVPSIDTSVFVKKSDVVDVVEAGNMNPVTSNAVVPVDEVTSGNMQSVTSNAVASALVNSFYIKDFSKAFVCGANDNFIVTISLDSVTGYKPVIIREITFSNLTNSNNLSIQSIGIGTSTLGASVRVGNRGASQLSGTLNISVVYIKNNMVNI